MDKSTNENRIPEYKRVELPDCCFTCQHSEFFQMNEYDPVCEHPSVRTLASGYPSQRGIVENGWCPLFSRD